MMPLDREVAPGDPPLRVDVAALYAGTELAA
jgi:hypothetical protein